MADSGTATPDKELSDLLDFSAVSLFFLSLFFLFFIFSVFLLDN